MVHFSEALGSSTEEVKSLDTLRFFNTIPYISRSWNNSLGFTFALFHK